jgi:hypothetical protein
MIYVIIKDIIIIIKHITKIIVQTTNQFPDFFTPETVLHLWVDPRGLQPDMFPCFFRTTVARKSTTGNNVTLTKNDCQRQKRENW